MICIATDQKINFVKNSVLREHIWHKKILTIGFELAEENAEYSSFDNTVSLLDWDNILIRPDK